MSHHTVVKGKCDVGIEIVSGSCFGLVIPCGVCVFVCVCVLFLTAFILGFLTSGDGTVRLYRNVCKNNHYSLRNNPEERRSYLLRGGSLKSRVGTVNIGDESEDYIYAIWGERSAGLVSNNCAGNST